MLEQLIALAIQQAPSIIAALRDLWIQQNPGVPPPTDAEVKAAYLQAFTSSIIVDEAWKTAHPEPAA